MRNQDAPFIRQITVPNPAAGADWRFTSDGQGNRRIIAYRAILTASAAVANRIPAFVLSDGQDDFATIPTTQAITAAQAAIFSAINGSGLVTQAGGPILVPSPTDGWLLLPGWSLRTVTAAIDVADQWSAIKLLVVEYPIGPTTRETPDVPSFLETA